MTISKFCDQRQYLFLLTLATLFLFVPSCKQKKDSIVDISQLTYLQFYDLIFSDSSKRIEWHEDSNNLEAVKFILKRIEGKCEENCGDKVYLKNSYSERSVHVIVKSTFSVPNMLPYIANHYTLAPGEEVFVACDLLCYKDDRFVLDHQVVVAEFVE